MPFITSDPRNIERVNCLSGNGFGSFFRRLKDKFVGGVKSLFAKIRGGFHNLAGKARVFIKDKGSELLKMGTTALKNEANKLIDKGQAMLRSRSNILRKQGMALIRKGEQLLKEKGQQTLDSASSAINKAMGRADNVGLKASELLNRLITRGRGMQEPVKEGGFIQLLPQLIKAVSGNGNGKKPRKRRRKKISGKGMKVY